MKINKQAILNDKHLQEVAADLIAYSLNDIDSYADLTETERKIISAEDFEKMTSKTTKIYVVHMDAYTDKEFNELTDEEIEQMYEKDSMCIDCYNNMEELAADWNADEIFNPRSSYMRIINS